MGNKIISVAGDNPLLKCEASGGSQAWSVEECFAFDHAAARTPRGVLEFDILQGNLDINLGSILENVMAQLLKSNGFDLHYYNSKKNGEVDFVIQNGMRVDLIEVKSGNDYKKHHALSRLMKVENWKFDKKYVFCKGNVECADGVVYLPWYMIMFYRREQIPETLLYEIDLSGL